MNTSEFSEAIAKYTLEETVNSIVSTMRQERKGELPEETTIRNYYGSMDDAGKAFAQSLVRYSVSSAIF
jgi:hypothetical protein